MEQEIINRFNSYKYDYVKINDDDILSIVYNLFFKRQDKIEEDIIINNPLLCYYFGVYYDIEVYINSKYKKTQMKKYYGKAIENGMIEAMVALGRYYYKCNKYMNMLKYHSMALKQGSNSVLYYLGCYYYYIKDYQQMLEYFLRSVNHGDVRSMNALGSYYQGIKDYELMKK